MTCDHQEADFRFIKTTTGPRGWPWRIGRCLGCGERVAKREEEDETDETDGAAA